MKIKLENEKEIIKKIKELEVKGNYELKLAIVKAAIHVEGEAKKLTPVLTGRLRSSITHEMRSDGGKHSGTIGTNVHYAPYIEFGTTKSKAQPYLIPALMQSASKILKLLTTAIQRLK